MATLPISQTPFFFSNVHPGELIPWRTEQAYLTLEQAYSAANVEAASPLFVAITGGLLNRIPMEGPERHHFITYEVLDTSPGAACAQLD